MLKRKDCLSIGRVCALFTWIVWLSITEYLVVMDKIWAHYDTLTIASFVFLLVQVCNKYVDSKLFSVKEGEQK